LLDPLVAAVGFASVVVLVAPAGFVGTVVAEAFVAAGADVLVALAAVGCTFVGALTVDVGLLVLHPIMPTARKRPMTASKNRPCGARTIETPLFIQFIFFSPSENYDSGLPRISPRIRHWR
jgi:hypothetical protein